MKSEDICFFVGKLCQTYTVCWKAETLLCLQRSIYSQGYGFPSGHVWLWELDCKEGRVLKNWCLQTMVLEKTSESPLGSKEIKPVNLKGNQPWKLLEGLMLKLKLRYFGHLMPIANSLEKSLMLWKIQGRRRRGCQRMRWLDGITSIKDMNLGKLGRWWGTEKPGVLQFMGLQRFGHDLWLNNNRPEIPCRFYLFDKREKDFHTH